jgi:predicted O-methyltransferase YrrM
VSSISRPFTVEHVAYLAERTRGDDSFLVDLKAAAAEAGIPSIWISPEQASLMQVLLKVAGAKEVIEVGTLAGYSAITMARALPADGRVRTVELEDRHADFTEDWVARSDVAGRVEVHRGRGVDVLPGFDAGSADACFLDADKCGYADYLTESLRILRPGGLVMVDNAFAFGQLLDERPSDPEVGAVRAFNDHVPTVPGLHAVIVPIGDGLWVGVKE